MQEGALKKIKTTYDIDVMHMKLRYFMEHEYDPDQKCMVFHLDYSRRSDIDDSVGYWYVQPSGRTASRVYYSCECKLRGWVPGPVYNVLTKEALSKVGRAALLRAKSRWRRWGPLRSRSFVQPRSCAARARLTLPALLAQATTWVSRESVREYRNQQQGDGFVRFIAGVREAMEQMKLPPPPKPPVFVSRFIDARRDAVRGFVSSQRIGKAGPLAAPQTSL